jgi:hypothetical protein
MSDTTDILSPAQLDELATKLDRHQRAREREAPDRPRESPAEWAGRQWERQVRGDLESHARARDMATAREIALAATRKDRERCEQAIAKVASERAGLRAQLERDLAQLSVREREHTSRLAALRDEVESQVDAARIAPVEVKVEPWMLRRGNRDASLDAAVSGDSLARKLGRLPDRGRSLTANVGASA